MESLEARYFSVREQMAISAKGRAVTLIAVSKTKTIEEIEAVYRLGQRDFGENYVQELVEKARKLEERSLKDIRWHFIGHLQSNKVKLLIPHVHTIHTVHSLKLANEISKRWTNTNIKQALPIFIEVNIDKEESKSGVVPEETRELAKGISKMSGLTLLGLMSIPAFGTTSDAKAFVRLRQLEESCRPFTGGSLSMGMTDDFEIAIREGATHIRVGTAIFTKRSGPPFGKPVRNLID